MKNYNVKNQSGIILIAHPNGYMRKALIMVLKKYCKNVLEERGWQDLPIKEISSIGEIINFEEKDNIEILITHIDSVSPDSRDIAHIRQLRMDGMRAPLIAMSFSALNSHKVFIEKGHRLLIYTFQLIHLGEILRQIKPLELRAIKGFVQRVFCDVSYLETLFSAISHSMGHKKWNQIEMDIGRIQTYFGDKIVQELKDKINNLLNNRVYEIQDWQKCFDQIRREISCHTRY